jgi:hypothetical protein
MSTFSHDSGLPPEPPVTPTPVRHAPPAAPVSAAHRRELSADELASLPLQALLVRSGRLSIDQLSEALRENVSTGRSVEDIAVSRGWVPAEELDELRRAKAAHAPQLPHEQAAPVAPAPMPVQQFEPHPAQPFQHAQPVAAAPAPPAPVAAVIPPPPPPAPVHEAPVRTAPPIIETNGNGSTNGSVGVFLTLADGERIWVGRFASAEAGEQRAQEVIDALMRPEPGVWPRFGNRLIRPESVVAVEVSKRRDD